MIITGLGLSEIYSPLRNRLSITSVSKTMAIVRVMMLLLIYLLSITTASLFAFTIVDIPDLIASFVLKVESLQHGPFLERIEAFKESLSDNVQSSILFGAIIVVAARVLAIKRRDFLVDTLLFLLLFLPSLMIFIYVVEGDVLVGLTESFKESYRPNLKFLGIAVALTGLVTEVFLKIYETITVNKT